MIYPDNDLSAVLVFLVGIELAYDLGVDELFATFGSDIPITYNVEGVGDFNTLC